MQQLEDVRYAGNALRLVELEAVCTTNPDRLHTRYSVKKRAILHFRDMFATVTILDVSWSGLGLSGAPNVFVGDRVSIALLNGKMVSGVVRWWIAGRCGIEFLDDTPTLFQELIQRRDLAKLFSAPTG